MARANGCARQCPIDIFHRGGTVRNGEQEMCSHTGPHCYSLVMLFIPFIPFIPVYKALFY